MLFSAAVLALVIGAPGPSQSQDAPRGQQPSFRAGVTAVPIDVRVLDRDGRPITDLKKQDFTILEDGVRQTIAHFFPQTLATGAPRPGLRARPDIQPFDPSPQSHRVFLIVLGTRALGDPQRHPETLDALIRFVRERLLPQDQVAVLAPPRRPRDYNTATGFTSDRQKVVQVLETFRRPASDAGAAVKPQGSAVRADNASVFASPDALDKSPALKTELRFEDYVKAWGKQSLGDELAFLFYAIKYLRHMSGEKHLVFITERGPSPTWEQVKYLTSLASDARVALDTIQIGERAGSLKVPRLADVPDIQPDAPTGDVSNERGSPRTFANRISRGDAGRGEGGRGEGRPAATEGGPRESAIFDNPLSLAAGGWYDLRYVAAQTGGQASILKDADPAFGRIDTATRAHYLLAYYPSSEAWNGRFRSIKVTLNRPGATVFFRHGYYARRDADLFDRRRIVADTRIEGAGFDLRDIRDIDVKFVPSFKKAAEAGGGEVLVSLSIDVSRLAWTTGEDGRHVAHLEVAIYCGDGGDKIVGQARRELNLALTVETYQRVMKERFARDMRAAVGSRPRLVKVIVYDYDADLVGSALVKMR